MLFSWENGGGKTICCRHYNQFVCRLGYKHRPEHKCDLLFVALCSESQEPRRSNSLCVEAYQANKLRIHSSCMHACMLASSQRPEIESWADRRGQDRRGSCHVWEEKTGGSCGPPDEACRPNLQQPPSANKPLSSAPLVPCTSEANIERGSHVATLQCYRDFLGKNAHTLLLGLCYLYFTHRQLMKTNFFFLVLGSIPNIRRATCLMTCMPIQNLFESQQLCRKSNFNSKRYNDNSPEKSQDGYRLLKTKYNGHNRGGNDQNRDCLQGGITRRNTISINFIWISCVPHRN